MLRHSDIWNAIDRLALDRGLSASGLAKKAGLDPTTFNKSKRKTSDGKERWPSTESISKVLQATSASLSEFVSYIGGGSGSAGYQNIPVIGFAQAGTAGYFGDAGYPTGAGWDEIPFLNVGDPHAYALEVSGDSMEPVYRDGDVIIVSPEAETRRGDRVVLKTREGEVMAKILRRKTSYKYELSSLNTEHPDRWLAAEDVEWIARIVWASQ
jgi:phage repressor protein C with HTH and peptisase S24 domain